ncbi:MAG: HDOD domain-containing protein [Candidatus Gastranaerophilales bacterium]|nr:HDOD domain-containing protein [Candidatus Gastranaerophilales bacterium]
MDDMSQILNTIKELPAMPNVIMHALNVMKDPDSSAKELAKVISYDQSLSTKVLTLVNSAYYGFSQQVTSIARAIALIGMSKAKNIIITVAMRPMLMNQGDKELWKHSIKTAVGCEYIAKSLKIMDADEAFVIGFLHDLGKVVLNLKDPALYTKVKETAQVSSNIVEIERLYFGTDHCQMGSLLTKRWQLPLLINNTTKYHHNPNLSSMPTACTLVYLVDLLVQDNFDPETLDPDIMKNLNIKIDQPLILKENVLAKAEILLNELST